ncbi:hypothetical protein [Candidatus Bathycorpusculum sp.]|uniref:hypothetical protein n=1 Tax=Candidatus Bathycorpusculum sp. TaxID=2994959 RepID=UPI00282FAF74|nr:hypothetical protein [Candidatus Termitimicrobium sp.]
METDAAKRILKNLLTSNIIGAKHTSTTNALKILPKHNRGDGEKTLKQLRTLGYVTFHPTSCGMEVSINPAKIGEIKNLIKDT